MKLLTKAQRDKLAWNGRERDDPDPKPVCKVVQPLRAWNLACILD